MRALYYQWMKEQARRGEVITLTGPKLHHLINVVRIKLKESLLLLNGKGGCLNCEVISISKNKMEIVVNTEKTFDNSKKIHLFLGLTKKENFLNSLSSAQQLGVREVTPILTKYSQRYDLNFSRIEKIITSSLEQANCSHLIRVNHPLNIESIQDSLNSQTAIYFSSNSSSEEKEIRDEELDLINLIIGPEGGLAPSEEEFLDSFESISRVHLNLPILKAQTMVPVGITWVLSKFNLNLD